MAVVAKRGRAYFYVASVALLLIFVGVVQQHNGRPARLRDAIVDSTNNLWTFGSQEVEDGGSSANFEESAIDNLGDTTESYDSSAEHQSFPGSTHSSGDHSSGVVIDVGADSGYDSSSSLSSSSSSSSSAGGDSIYSESIYDDDDDEDDADMGEQLSFYDIAIEKGTDKVTMHTYHDMYERYLPAMRRRKIKLLEIGLGCTMAYGPGPSYHTWLQYFPYVDLYFIDADAECVDKWRDKMKGAKVISGDQADKYFLEGVIDKYGGDFDLIIDDGGHQMDQQMVSLQTLWKAVKPGGVYFVEDLETSYLDEYGGGKTASSSLKKTDTMVQYIHKMMEDLMYPDARMEIYRSQGDDKDWERKVQFDEVESITHIDCGKQICAFSKRRD